MEEKEFTIRERIEGYRAVNALDLEERRRATIEQRVRDFLTIVASAGLWPSATRDDSQYWDNWAKIKDAYDRRHP